MHRGDHELPSSIPETRTSSGEHVHAMRAAWRLLHRPSAQARGRTQSPDNDVHAAQSRDPGPKEAPTQPADSDHLRLG